MANPTDNTSTPTGVPSGGSVNSNPWQQQFVVWSQPWAVRNSMSAWNAYQAQIPATGQLIK